MLACKGSIEWFALHLANYMGHVVIAAIGNGSTQIGNLKRCGIYLTLSDSYRNNRKSVPRALVSLIVELGIGNQSSFLAWQIDTQTIAETHGYHIVAPCVHGILHRTVFRDVRIDHVVESPAEVTITRSTKRRHQGQRGGMSVTSHVQTLEVETMSAGIHRLRGNHTFSHERQSLCGLESGAWRILTHDTTVKQRLPYILRQQTVILRA